MRLLQVDLESFRAVEDEWLPARGLVVLFGANSAGKTSVLEAVADVITGTAALRSDPGQFDDNCVLGSFTFQLPDASVAGTEDALAYASLLSGEQAGSSLSGEPKHLWPWLGESAKPGLKNAKAHRVRAVLAAALAGAGSQGIARDRLTFARAIFNPACVYFTADAVSTWMFVHGPAITGAAADAGRRIAAVCDADDPLGKIALALEAEDVAYIGEVGGGVRQLNKFTSGLPPVILLDGDHESLSLELFRAVRAVHNRLWHVEPELVSTEPFKVYTVDGYAILDETNQGHYAADPWLESRTDDSEPARPDAWGPYWEGDWYRVRHSVLAAARLIEIEANNIAPSFVRSMGTIGIEVLPVAVWGTSGHRVRATFAEHTDNELRDLRVVGAGTARWAAAAVRLACHRLETGRQIVLNDQGEPVTAPKARREVIRQARLNIQSQTTVRLEPSDAPGFYIADEPEAHLHPAAVRSVRDWLTELAESSSTVLVATHSAALLDGNSALISRVLVERTGNATHLRLMSGALGDELAAVSDDLGLTKGELLLLTRLAVFVEGPHDQIILDEWFGEELRGAGIHIYPVHGIDNLVGLAESELAAAIGLRIATLSDDTSVRRLAEGRVRTRGESAVARLITETARTGTEVRPVGLSQPDILYYLDKTICQQAAPAFPGWAEATTERHRAGSREPWKRWIEIQYGLSLTRESVRELARQCRNQGKIPAEMKATIQEVINYAAQELPDRT